jgi:hypothetical protein
VSNESEQLLRLLAWAKGRQLDARGFKSQAPRAAACNAYAAMQREIEAVLESTREKFVQLVRNEEDDDLDLFEDFEDAQEYAEMFEGSTREEVPVLGREQARFLIEESREGEEQGG